MTYTVKAHPTRYSGVQFRSRLEARWAAFFDLMGWKWSYEAVDLHGWVPDFHLIIPHCISRDCDEAHELYVEVKPHRAIEEFIGHPVSYQDPYSVPAPAMFGLSPDCTEWQMSHKHGDNIYLVPAWGAEAETVSEMWKEAGNVVQWSPRR